MDINKFLHGEHVTYQNETGEQKIYVLPNAEAVEQMVAKLRESGLSDTVKVTLSAEPQPKSNSKNHDTLLDDMGTCLQQMTKPSPTPKPVGDIEQLFSEYLALDGEQKVYVLPADLKVDQILGSVNGIRTGEIKQSQMWRKTDVKIDSNNQSTLIEEIHNDFAKMDQRIKRLEYLLNQVVEREHAIDTEIK